MLRLLPDGVRLPIIPASRLLSLARRARPRTRRPHHIGLNLLLSPRSSSSMAISSSDNVAGEWSPVIKPGVPAYKIFTRPIRKSEQDDREYRVIRLENGLEATLVRDATADKAAASLDVAVGHLSDPVSVVGDPVFEHMVEVLLG